MCVHTYPGRASADHHGGTTCTCPSGADNVESLHGHLSIAPLATPFGLLTLMSNADVLIVAVTSGTVVSIDLSSIHT